MIYEPLAPYTIDDDRFKGYMSSGWITDLNSSDSRIHKEKVIEKALTTLLDLLNATATTPPESRTTEHSHLK